MSKINESFEIQADHKEWLESMVEEYNLTDASKALRILLDYALEDGDAGEIFQTVRCRHC